MKELALYILDLSQNSLRAGAKNLYIELQINNHEDMLTVRIEDDGCGMNEELLKNALNPFTTTRKERRVGLGLPLFKELTELCSGAFNISSDVGKGTKLIGTFKLSSIDLVPVGDMSATIVSLILSAPNVDIVYRYRKDSYEFSFDTKELRYMLKDVKLSDIMVLNWIKEYISENMNMALEV